MEPVENTLRGAKRALAGEMAIAWARASVSGLPSSELWRRRGRPSAVPLPTAMEGHPPSPRLRRASDHGIDNVEDKVERRADLLRGQVHVPQSHIGGL